MAVKLAPIAHAVSAIAARPVRTFSFKVFIVVLASMIVSFSLKVAIYSDIKIKRTIGTRTATGIEPKHPRRTS